MWQKTYSISINPNIELDDLKLAGRLLGSKKERNKRKNSTDLAQKLKTDYKAKKVYLCNAGRSALYLGLKSLDLPPGSEVLTQSFTCVANLNSILMAELKTVFVDCAKDRSKMDVADLVKKITPRSKVLIVQHSFGYPDDLKEIKKICAQHSLILIEDCAHNFDSKYQGQKLGTHGAMSFFSFGRDKVLSSVFGGALIIHRDHLLNKADSVYQTFKYPKKIWVIKCLLYPFIMEIILLFFGFLKVGKLSFGKILLFLYQRSGLLIYPVSEKEKQLDCSLQFPARMSHAQAKLALNQYAKKNIFAKRRKKFLQLWLKSLLAHRNLSYRRNDKGLILLRLPVFSKNPKKIINLAEKEGLLLGNWYRPAISPKGVNLPKNIYDPLAFPHAEKLSEMVFNLPLCPRYNESDQKEIIKRFNKISIHVNSKLN